jgi:molecular chaperone GrpE
MSRAEDENDGQATERVVIRDKRKIHPEGKPAEGAVSQDDEKAHEPAAGEQSTESEPARADEEEPAQPGLGAELEALRSELDERTRDLQRVTAEYANYRKRVDRDRGAAAEQTTGAVLLALLPVLDDVDRAREHGDLVGPFATVAESLTAVTGKLGLVAFGE